MIKLKGNKRKAYQIWLLVFGIAFILGFLQSIFGTRALISIIMRHPAMLKVEWFYVLQDIIYTLICAVLGIAAIILFIKERKRPINKTSPN